MDEVKEPQMSIEQTKELMEAVLVVSVILVKHLKDGVQLSDLGPIISEIQARPEIMAGVKGSSLVGMEMKDISFAEGVELLALIAQKIPSILEAFKK